MLILLLSSVLFAQNAIDLSLIKYGQVETSNPAVELTFNQATNRFSMDLQCGSKHFHKDAIALSSGKKIKVELPIPKGKAKCSGSLDAEFADETTGSMPLNFSIEMLDALTIEIDRTSVDMNAKKLKAKGSRSIARFEVQLLNVEQKEIGSGGIDVPKSRNMSPQDLEWSAANGEVAIIRIRAKDVYGFWSSLDLLPWHYDIPHEDVIFESNKEEILATEEPKLVDVKKEIDAVFTKYEKIAKANLYVAGYTDTVGSAGSNQALSKKRAKSIALWFKKQGFRGKIYYQGFGESALAVPTGDGVDQPENRRALYIVAAEAPPRSTDVPKKNWTLLP
jgi:outer membrane protein OmpA-like peptidoglycan-associated protein